MGAIWLIELASTLFMVPFMAEVKEVDDQYFWFTLQDPGGGSLSYPFLCISYFQFLHFLSGEDLLLFAKIAAFASFLFFIATLAVFLKMGINPKKLFLLSVLVQPVFIILLMRVEIIPVFLSLLAFWLFHSGKKAEGWLALLAGAFFKVFPLFLAPLFLAAELKNFNKGSALRLLMAGAISLLAFFMFPDNLRTVIFNSARGIQVESLYANALLIANWALGLGITVAKNYGSYHLVLPEYLSALPTIALALQALSVLAISAIFFLRGAKKEELFVYAFLSVTAMILFSKVFSTQFMLWPLIFAIPVFAVPWKDSKIDLRFLPPALALYFSSAAAYFVYPILWYFLITVSPIAIAGLTLKNLLLLAVFIWVFINREEFYLKTDSK